MAMVIDEGVRQVPRRLSDARLAFFRAVERLLVVAGGRRYYRSRFLTRARLVVREETVRVAGLPAALDGFLVAHLSDVHAGPFLGGGDLAVAIELANAAEPDLVAFTGDLVTHDVSEAFDVIGDLAGLESRLGTFAVFGNHDYKDRREGEIVQACEAHGVRFLRNAAVRLDVGGATLAVVGLEDLEEGKVVDLGAARSSLGPDDVEVMLCHNPGGAPALVRDGCAVVLSGHTHGSQVDLPWLRELGPTHPGLRVDFGPTTLITSRGLGAVGVPFRFRAPAEVVLVRLEAA